MGYDLGLLLGWRFWTDSADNKTKFQADSETEYHTTIQDHIFLSDLTQDASNSSTNNAIDIELKNLSTSSIINLMNTELANYYHSKIPV